MKNIFLILYLLISINLYAGNSTVLIGTYVEKNEDIELYLIKNNVAKKTKIDAWSLSNHANTLLETKYSQKLEKLNIILKNDFAKNTKEIVEKGNVRDRKIGFFHLNSYQNVRTTSGGFSQGLVTFNLTFVQLGEEANRMTSNNTFEARYTHGITLLLQAAIEKGDSLNSIYTNGFDKALEMLLDSMIADKENKEASNLMSDDIYFSIDDFRVSKKLQSLSNAIFKNEKNAKRQLLMMYQENLIQKIRLNKKLNDVVLLYPNVLNEFILKNWDEYLIRINELSKNSLKDDDAQIIIRHIKPACETKDFDGRNRYINGYLIQAFLSDLSNTTTEENDHTNYKACNVSALSRVILKLGPKKFIDGLSTEKDVIKDINTFVAESSNGYFSSKTMDTRNDYEIVKTVRKAIDLLSEKTVKHIAKMQKKRKNKIFIYENFCKGI